MDWKDVAKLVAPLAPTAGSILGGLIPFPGGALIGEQFGKIIARQFGVPETPQAVSDAIARTDADKAIATINAATERARVEIDGFVRYEEAVQKSIQTSIEQVNQTMRVELLPENRHWFFTGGRAAAMWVLVTYLAALASLAVWASAIAMIAGRTEPLKVLTDAWPLHAVIVGALAALVGVFIRSPEGKVTAFQMPTPAPATVPKVVAKH